MTDDNFIWKRRIRKIYETGNVMNIMKRIKSEKNVVDLFIRAYVYVPIIEM